MSKPTYVLVAHMGHDAPWLQIKTREQVEDRIAYIKTDKPKMERPLRLKLLKIIKESLPLELQKAYAEWQKAYAEWHKTHAKWRKSYAGREKTYAGREKTYAEWQKAYAEWQKADAEWQKTINSPEGVALHKRVCGCAWTPEQPDILLQLNPKED